MKSMEPTSKIDKTGATIKIRDDGMILVDGVIIGKRIIRASQVFIQFCDGDRLRSSCRGTRLIDVPIDALRQVLSGEGKP